MSTVYATYQLRGYLNRSGYAQLDCVLVQCAVLCNAAFQNWRDAWRMAGERITLCGRMREFAQVRAGDDFWCSLNQTLAGAR